MRILVVDDEHVADPLVADLTRHGHLVLQVATGEDALHALPQDLVLMELNLPDLDGCEVCRRLRQISDVPIIVLTNRSNEIDRVMGLQAGADDYVVKPHAFHELLARIEAVTRRVHRSGQVPQHAESRIENAIAVAKCATGLDIDSRTRRANLNGAELKLTRKEFELLEFLFRDPGAVCTRDEIIQHVWDENWVGSTRTLDVHIGSLRVKLGGTDRIETVRGVGFRLVEVMFLS